MPAQATAKSVMASAKRLIDVRHSCRSSRRMAEISVPAWPMPIHQTKLMMSKPQPTGWLMPQMPTPFANSQVTQKRNSIRRLKEMPKPTYHHFGVLRSTTELILSVTVPGVWPGATTGGLYGFGRGESIVAMLRPFLVLRMCLLGSERGVRVGDLR